MRLVFRSSPRAAAAAAAAVVTTQLAGRPDSAFALPTGRTAIALYAALVARHRAGSASFAAARFFNLDEFQGLSQDDPRSFAAFLHEFLLRHIDASPRRVRLLDGAARAWRAEAGRHERAIQTAGGLDLAILGVGGNGHIAFNEPCAALPPRTHRVRLSAATRQAQRDRFRPAVVPRYAVTMGVGTILQARRVLLLATGKEKAAIVARAFAGPITTQVPASLLQVHPDVTIVVDRAAGRLIRRASTPAS
jgi:glucosamine-6-phosphate deaminase